MYNVLVIMHVDLFTYALSHCLIDVYLIIHLKQLNITFMVETIARNNRY